MKTNLKFAAFFLAWMTAFGATVLAGSVGGILTDVNEKKQMVKVDTGDDVQKLKYTETTQWPAEAESRISLVGSNVIVTTDENNMVTGVEAV